MFSIFSEILQKRGITLFAPIPLSACRMTRKYLLDRERISDGTVVMMAVPYFSHGADVPGRNLSAYAVPRDYHLFFREFFDEILPELKSAFPGNRFAGFADHSPIDERDAALKAGLGVLGDNGLLLTEKYSSYVFLGEIVTDAVFPTTVHPMETCKKCGKCKDICPSGSIGTCLSALTQKKGELTAAEKKAILSYGCAWGCDLCQEVCPYTAAAKRNGTIYSDLPFFNAETIPVLSSGVIEGMSDAEFAVRAYSWRGRETILRNLRLFEGKSEKEEPEKC